MPRNYTAVLQDGSSVQVDDVPDDVHPNDLLAKVESKWGQPVKEMVGQGRAPWDEAKQLVKDAIRGPMKYLGEGFDATMNNAPFLSWGQPKTDEGAKLVERLNPTPKNDTPARQLLRAGVEGGTGAAANPASFANLLRNVIAGGAAGAGSEMAGQASNDNPLARVAGGLAGGAAGGLATAAKTTRGQLASSTLEGVKESDLQVARQVMEEARKHGISLNLSQAMPTASNIDRLMETLANNPNGKEVIRLLRGQPESVGMAVEGQMGALPGRVKDPQVVANEAQDAATDIITGVKQARTSLVSPLYNNAGDLGSKAPQALALSIDRFNGQAGISPKVIARAKALQQEILESSANGKPRTDAADIKAAIDSFQGGIKDTINPLSPQEQGQMKYLVKQLYGQLEQRSPIIGMANKIYGSVSENVVDPLKKSVVGRLAGKSGAHSDQEAVRGKVFQVLDAGTIPGSATSEILTLEKSLRGGKKQEVFQDAVKTWMATKLSDAQKQSGGRASERTAANLESVFVGDPAKEKGFNDMLVGLARSKGLPDDALLPGMRNLMKYVSASARRPAKVGGITEQGIDEASRSGVARTVGNFSMIQPFRAVGQRIDDALNADAYGFMDRLLTTPEGVDTLRKLGKTPIMSKKMTDTLSTFVGTAAADTPTDE